MEVEPGGPRSRVPQSSMHSRLPGLAAAATSWRAVGTTLRPSLSDRRDASCVSPRPREHPQAVADPSSGFNLGLLMRQVIGVGTPRGLQGRLSAVIVALLSVMSPLREAVARHWSPVRPLLRFPPLDCALCDRAHRRERPGFHHGLLTPAPRTSATSITSSPAWRAPAPTSIATFCPALSRSAARRRSASRGTTRGLVIPIPV
jgi:hypothetical protein